MERETSSEGKTHTNTHTQRRKHAQYRDTNRSILMIEILSNVRLHSCTGCVFNSVNQI